MATVKKTKKAFTLVEMLVCLCIVSIFCLLSLSHYESIDLDHFYFLNDYLYIQSQSMVNRDNISFQEGINFNCMGHVNRAKTIDFGKHKVIIHLGNGYASKE